MTQIEYDEKTFYLKAKGHAGGGTAGNDIICAGISVLTQALLNVLTDEEEAGRIELEWYMKPGEIHLQALPMSAFYRATKDYFHMAVTGLKDIAAQYPQNIEIREVKKDGNT